VIIVPNAPGAHVSGASQITLNGVGAYLANEEWRLDWFDGNSATGSGSTRSTRPTVLGQRFTDISGPTGYTLVCSTSQNVAQMPRDWSFQGLRTSDSTWETLGTESSETAWSQGEMRSYSASGVNTYYGYRISVANDNNANASGIFIGELSVAGTVDTYVSDKFATGSNASGWSAAGSVSVDSTAIGAASDLFTHDISTMWQTAGGNNGYVEIEGLTGFVLKSFAYSTNRANDYIVNGAILGRNGGAGATSYEGYRFEIPDASVSTANSRLSSFMAFDTVITADTSILVE